MTTARAMKKFRMTGTGTVLTAGERGMYYIPKVMVRKMTRRKSSYLSAIISNKAIVIDDCSYGLQGSELVYVDAKGNLRIPQALVKKAKISMTERNPYVVAIQDSQGNIILA